MGNFQKLHVWQVAKEIAIEIYGITRKNDFSKDFGLKDQIQRSAVSIASNIAEGNELGSDKSSVRHFYIAKGSAAELLTQIIIASEIGYLTTDVSTKLVDECDRISAMLSKLIISRSKELA